MKVDLTSVEKMTLSAIAAFPIAVFDGPVVDRLISLGLVEKRDEWLEVTDAGRDVIEAIAVEDVIAPDHPIAGSDQGSSGSSGAPSA